MTKQHRYQTSLTWTGNRGSGTIDYRAYDRDHLIRVKGKPDLRGSADPSFRGNPGLYNPEEMLVASLSACHMLWYLHLCSDAGVIVVDYQDEALGVMEEQPNGSGVFTSVTLHPLVIVTQEAMFDKAKALHQQANKMCFIANSCNFPVFHKPVLKSSKELNR